MRSSPLRRLFLSVATVALLATACGSGDDTAEPQPEIDDETSASVTTIAPATSLTTIETTTSAVPTTAATVPATASQQAIAFSELGPRLTSLGDGVLRFAELLDPVRIDQLAQDSCATVSPDMTDSALGLAGLAAYDNLTSQERGEITEQDWVVFYGALAGFFCPENLPEIDLDAAPLTEGTPVDQFRSVVSQIDGVSIEAEDFVADLSDERLDEIQGLACVSTNSDMTTEEFGLAIVSSYQSELTETERSAISLSGYSELYGTMVGWFCPANLPL